MTRSPDLHPSPPRQGLGALLILAMGVTTALVLLSSRSSLVGEPAPALALTSIQGGPPVRLDEFKGKVVLIDFWATWCPPCRKQMPALQRLHEDPSLRQDLQILSVNADEDDGQRDAKVPRFMQANGYTMLTVWAQWPTLKAYHVESFPTLVILDRQHVVRHVLTGAHDEARLRALIRQTLDASP